jgi:hypothetical protein
MALVRPVSHRLSCINETVRNAPIGTYRQGYLLLEYPARGVRGYP